MLSNSELDLAKTMVMDSIPPELRRMAMGISDHFGQGVFVSPQSLSSKRKALIGEAFNLHQAYCDVLDVEKTISIAIRFTNSK